MTPAGVVVLAVALLMILWQVAEIRSLHWRVRRLERERYERAVAHISRTVDVGPSRAGARTGMTHPSGPSNVTQLHR